MVDEGDTLVSISEETGIDLDELVELNPDIDPQALITGQRISLRAGEVTAVRRSDSDSGDGTEFTEPQTNPSIGGQHRRGQLGHQRRGLRDPIGAMGLVGDTARQGSGSAPPRRRSACALAIAPAAALSQTGKPAARRRWQAASGRSRPAERPTRDRGQGMDADRPARRRRAGQQGGRTASARSRARRS